jgi:hypothetical protein
LDELDDLVDELQLPWWKLVGNGLAHQLRQHPCVDCGSAERAELIDESTKLASPQEHRVVLDVVDSHGSRHGVPASCMQKTGRILYFEIQLNMKKKATALTAITAQTPAPIVFPSSWSP